jgi:hypothetical protein
MARIAIVTTMTDWPPNKVILAAINGLRQVHRLPSAEQIMGVRCGDLVFTGAVLSCLRCDEHEQIIPMPTSQGLNGKPEPLFRPDSDAGVLVVRGWLARRKNEHEEKHKAMMPEGWES